MLLKDFLVTPIFLLIIYSFAFITRKYIADKFSKRIFLPALTLKLISAILLGIIYQFYYQGGDTFSYFNESQIIHKALTTDFTNGVSLLLSNGTFDPETYQYSSLLRWYRFPSEFTVVKFAAVFSVIGFGTYSTIAILFSLFSFWGLWLMYNIFCKIDPKLKYYFAIAIFFIPSVVFWGSGLLKDSLMMGCLGLLFYGFYNLFISRTNIIKSLIYIFIAFIILYYIRIYILLGFVPPALVWVFMTNNKKIRNPIIRRFIAPIFIALGVLFAYLFAVNITEGHSKYDLSKISERTKINAQYLYRVSIAQDGSAYYLEGLDGTIESMVKIAPQAIFVTLFRPLLWEARNPLMLISAIESFVFLVFTVLVLFKTGPVQIIKLISANPFLLFSIIFTLALAVAIGLNSFNFGTLVRYKISILPFYFSFLAILYFHRRANIINDV